jgi:hypothetical protein
VRINTRPRLSIFQLLEPFDIFISLPDFYHKINVFYGIQKRKENLVVIVKIFLRRLEKTRDGHATKI